MRERTEQILKLVCAVLLALLVAQVVKAGLRASSLRGVAIPSLPALESDTNALLAGGTNVGALAGKGTNSRSDGTNLVSEKSEKQTNSVAKSAKQSSTNNAGPLTPSNSPSARAKESGGTAVSASGEGSNSAAVVQVRNVETNLAPATTNLAGSNAVAQDESSSNATPATVATDNSVLKTNAAGSPTLTSVETNGISIPANVHAMAAVTGINASASSTNVGTNVVSSASSPKKGTNSSAPRQMAINGGPPGMRGGAPAPDLAPEIKARVNRIYESELFGPVMRPQPMALMGIAGNTAFLRSPGGQTGLVKEGDTLGEIKLLRIGINRVLIEQGGEKKELTIFQGYGSKSLLEDSK